MYYALTMGLRDYSKLSWMYAADSRINTEGWPEHLHHGMFY
jgi:hypothetical protein